MDYLDDRLPEHERLLRLGGHPPIPLPERKPRTAEPREWVTYEVQWRSPFAADDEPWDESARPDSPKEALAILRKERNRFPEHDFRAVAITHTERVIG